MAYSFRKFEYPLCINPSVQVPSVHNWFSSIFPFSETGEALNIIPISGPKITSAIWGPYEEYIITGHEDGRICQYDVKVSIFIIHIIHYVNIQ